MQVHTQSHTDKIEKGNSIGTEKNNTLSVNINRVKGIQNVTNINK